MRLGPIEFIAPPLVEGPAIMFYVPLPHFMQHIPFAMEYADGRYGLPVTLTVVSTWFVILVLGILFRMGTRKLEMIPGRAQVAAETVYNFLYGIIHQMLGDWTVKYFSYLASLFLFILGCNLLMFVPIPWGGYKDGVFALAPLFRAPTADLNTTVGLALLTTCAFLGTSIKLNGILGYIKGLFAPIPVMLPINIVGELAKPTNISIRLFGNMFAGSVILGLIYKAAPAIIPIPLHLYFDIFSGVVQSFVFLMLSMVYIQGAIGDAKYSENK